MTRSVARLTDIRCRNAKYEKGGRNRLFDGGGLYLELLPSGSKKWRLKYRQPNGKENRLTFGDYPQVTLSQARIERENAKQIIKEGRDPSLERDLARAKLAEVTENTFQKLAEEWLLIKKSTWSDGYYQRIANALKANVYPHMGHLPIQDLTGLFCLTVVQRVEKRGAYEMASRVLDSIGQVFKYAVGTGRVAQDVTAELSQFLQQRPPVQHFPHIQHDSLPELIKRIKTYTGRPETVYAIKLMMHTFPRTNELRWAEWNEFDLENRLWTIPASRMKGRISRKQAGADHLVPLSSQVLKLLDSLHKLTGRHRFLFPGMRNPSTSPISAETINKALKIMGYEGQQTGHGFRSLASTILNESGLFRREAIDAQLAHVNRNKVEAAYNRATYLEERRQILQWWSDYLDKLPDA